MADNVGVRPSTTSGSVNVATDEIDGVHHPEYKLEYGAKGTATPVDEDNPLPVFIEAVFNSRVLTALNELITEMKINNAYQSLAHDCKITDQDIGE